MKIYFEDNRVLAGMAGGFYGKDKGTGETKGSFLGLELEQLGG